MNRLLLSFALFVLACCQPLLAAEPFADTIAQRALACTGCHGKEGRAGPDGYYPRIAGKPAGYLYAQLLNFRDGRRHYPLMSGLVQNLSDAYLRELAEYFATLNLPYAAPEAAVTSPDAMRRGQQLATLGDQQAKLPACAQCHGKALTGVVPDVPGLLGLPRNYINAQLRGWQTGQRRAHAPDCMQQIANRLSATDIDAVANWLGAQVVPADAKPVVAARAAPPLECGSAAQSTGKRP